MADEKKLGQLDVSLSELQNLRSKRLGSLTDGAVDFQDLQAGTGESLFGSFVQGAADVTGSALEGAGFLTRTLASERKKPFAIEEFGQKVKRLGETATNINPEVRDSFGGKFASGLGSTVPFFATALTGPVGVTLGGLTAAAAGAGEQLEDIRQATQGEASFDDEVKAALSGTVVGAVDILPAFSAVKRLDKVTGGFATKVLKNKIKGSAIKQVLAEGGQGAFEEGIQEIIQQVGQNYIANGLLAYDPDRKTFEHVGEAGGVGATVGFALNTLLAAFGIRTRGKLEKTLNNTSQANLQDEVKNFTSNIQEAQDILNKSGDQFLTPYSGVQFQNKNVQTLLQRYSALSTLRKQKLQAGESNKGIQKAISAIKQELETLKTEEKPILSQEKEEVLRFIEENENITKERLAGKDAEEANKGNQRDLSIEQTLEVDQNLSNDLKEAFIIKNLRAQQLQQQEEINVQTDKLNTLINTLRETKNAEKNQEEISKQVSENEKIIPKQTGVTIEGSSETGDEVSQRTAQQIERQEETIRKDLNLPPLPELQTKAVETSLKDTRRSIVIPQKQQVDVEEDVVTDQPKEKKIPISDVETLNISSSITPTENITVETTSTVNAVPQIKRAIPKERSSSIKGFKVDDFVVIAATKTQAVNTGKISKIENGSIFVEFGDGSVRRISKSRLEVLGEQTSKPSVEEDVNRLDNLITKLREEKKTQPNAEIKDKLQNQADEVSLLADREEDGISQTELNQIEEELENIRTSQSTLSADERATLRALNDEINQLEDELQIEKDNFGDTDSLLEQIRELKRKKRELFPETDTAKETKRTIRKVSEDEELETYVDEDDSIQELRFSIEPTNVENNAGSHAEKRKTVEGIASKLHKHIQKRIKVIYVEDINTYDFKQKDKVSISLDTDSRNRLKGLFVIKQTGQSFVYIFGQNANTKAEVARTLFHELVGHLGVRYLIEPNALTNLPSSMDNSPFSFFLTRMLNSTPELRRDILRNITRWRKYLDTWVQEGNSIDRLQDNEKIKFVEPNTGEIIIIPMPVALQLADEYMAVLAGNLITNKSLSTEVGIGLYDSPTRKKLRKQRFRWLNDYLNKLLHIIKKVFSKVFTNELTVNHLKDIVAQSADNLFFDTNFKDDLVYERFALSENKPNARINKPRPRLTLSKPLITSEKAPLFNLEDKKTLTSLLTKSNATLRILNAIKVDDVVKNKGQKVREMLNKLALSNTERDIIKRALELVESEEGSQFSWQSFVHTLENYIVPVSLYRVEKHPYADYGLERIGRMDDLTKDLHLNNIHEMLLIWSENIYNLSDFNFGQPLSAFYREIYRNKNFIRVERKFTTPVSVISESNERVYETAYTFSFPKNIERFSPNVQKFFREAESFVKDFLQIPQDTNLIGGIYTPTYTIKTQQLDEFIGMLKDTIGFLAAETASAQSNPQLTEIHIHDPSKEAPLNKIHFEGAPLKIGDNLFKYADIRDLHRLSKKAAAHIRTFTDDNNNLYISEVQSDISQLNKRNLVELAQLSDEDIEMEKFMRGGPRVITSLRDGAREILTNPIWNSIRPYIEMRSIREIVAQALSDGKSNVRFPMPLTIRTIENWMPSVVPEHKLLEKKYKVLEEKIRKEFIGVSTYKDDLGYSWINIPLQDNIDYKPLAYSLSEPDAENKAKKNAIDLGVPLSDVDAVSDLFNNKNFGKLSESAFVNRINSFGNLIQKNSVVSKFFALGNLPFDKFYEALSAITKGRIGVLEDLVVKASRSITPLNNIQKEEIYNYLTTIDADINALPISIELKKQLVEYKNQIADFGEYLYESGYVNPETWAENHGRYLTTVYAEYLVRFRGKGKSPSLLNWSKSKAGLSEEAKTALGEIKAPEYLLPETLGVVGRDAILLDYFKNISKVSKNNNLFWVLDEHDFYTFEKKKYTIDEIDSLIKSTEDLITSHEVNASTFNFSNTQLAQLRGRLTQLQAAKEQGDAALRQAVIDAAKQSGVEIEGSAEDFLKNNYRRMPKSKRMGVLSNQYVRKEIYNDLIDINSIFHIDKTDPVTRFFLPGGALERTHQYWKLFKVPFNVPSWFRNGVGNFVLLDTSTSRSSAQLMSWLTDEFQALVSNQPTEWTSLAKRMGLFGTTYSAVELQAIQRQWGDKLARAIESSNTSTKRSKIKQLYYAFDERFSIIMEGSSKLYGSLEGLFKTLAFRDYIESWELQNPDKKRSLLSDDELQTLYLRAAQQANKAIFDYSLVPSAIKFLRRYPLGSPFITFMYKAFPHTIENTFKHPIKMAKYLALPALINMIAQTVGEDWEDEEVKRVLENLPEYYTDNSSIVAMPFKDAEGRVQITDLSYLFPWSPYLDYGLKTYNHWEGNSIAGNFNSTIRSIENLGNDGGFLGGPLPQFILAFKNNTDAFTGQRIVNPNTSDQEQLRQALWYSWNFTVPSFISSHGFLGKLYDSFNVKDRLGRDKTTLGQAASSLFGFTATPIDPQESRNIKISKLDQEERAIITERNKILRKQISSLDKAKELQELNFKLQRFYEKRKEQLQN